MRYLILGFFIISLAGCRNTKALFADNPGFSQLETDRELYLHESLTGKKRDEWIMGQLRESRLRVDSAANGGGACQFGTLLGAAQDYAGKNLSQEQLDILKKELGKPGPSGRPAVDFRNYLVIGSEEVVRAALRALIGLEFQVLVKSPREMNRAQKDQAQYTMRITQGHRNLGDPEGKYLWEPLEYNLESSIKKGKPEDLRYIIILPL